MRHIKSQLEWLRDELEKGRSLSQMNMLLEGGIGNHTGRIADLRRDLFLQNDPRQIVTVWKESQGKRWAEYKLENKQMNLV